MRVEPLEPPREFVAGAVTIRHAADLWLEPDEQVTLHAPSGSQLDVVRKSWGYYATPSLNARLRDHGLSARLVAGARGLVYLLLVEDGAEADFAAYLAREGMRELCRLDDDDAAGRIAAG